MLSLTQALPCAGTAHLHGADCQHHFCRSCLAQHAGAMISQGAIDQLRCPEPSCRQPLQRHVGPEGLDSSHLEALSALICHIWRAGWLGLLVRRRLCSKGAEQGVQHIGDLAQ